MPKQIDTAEVVRRYQAGETSTQIGESFGVTSSTVLHALRKAGVTIRHIGRRSIITDELVEKVRGMVSDGHKRIVIALVLGVSQSTVNKAYRVACDEQNSTTS